MLLLASADDARLWAPVASALFASIAAAASWASVRTTRRQWTASQRPYVVLQVIDTNGERRFEIRNSGSGPAQGVRFCVVIGEEFASGFALPGRGGYLAPDETAVLATPFDPAAPAIDALRSVVTYWDSADASYLADTLTESPRRLKRARRRGSDSSDPLVAFESVYGTPPAKGRRKVEVRGQPKLRAGTTTAHQRD